MLKFAYTITRDLCIVVFVLVLFVVGALGTGLPYKFPIKSVGPFQLASFETGLALYQLNREAYFYALSPLNDYIVDDLGQRSVHLDWQTYQDGEFETQFDEATWLKSYDAFLGYFDKLDPYYTFASDDTDLFYSAKVEGNAIEVEKHIALKKRKKMIEQGMSMQYGENDIVFHPDKGFIFDGYEDSANVSNVNLLTSTYLNEQIPEASVSGFLLNKVTVANPNLPGLITLEASENQEIRVDPVYRIINLVEKYPLATDSATMKMKILVSEYSTDI